MLSITQTESVAPPPCSRSAIRWVFVTAIACLAATPVLAQTNTMQYVAIGASGTECPNGAADDPTSCDWYLDGSGGLVLNTVPQTIFWELILDEWGCPPESPCDGLSFPDNPLAAYAQEIFCDSLDNGTACIEPAPGGGENQCNAAGLEFGVDYCNGIDQSNPNFLFSDPDPGSIIVPYFFNDSCSIQVDTTPGICDMQIGAGVGALVTVPHAGPTYAEAGSMPKYGGQYAALVPAGARGAYDIIMHPHPGLTFMVTLVGENLEPITRVPMHVEIASGRCCGVAGEPLMCGDDYVPSECAAAGGVFTADATCCGADQEAADGLDDACHLCDDEIVAEGGACDDGDACTTTSCSTNSCDGVACSTISTPVAEDPNLCCDPATGNGTVIDDGDDCTADSCDPDTGEVSHEPLDTPECAASQSVPTVSAWGLAVLALLLLVVGKLSWGRRVSM